MVEAYPNCRYLNMLDKGIGDFQTDISPDKTHLNYSGARKATTYLGAFLKEHYELPDHTQDDSWKENYREYAEYKKAVLKEQMRLTDYLVQLTDSDPKAEAVVYDPWLLHEGETELCVRITVQNADSGEMVEEAVFTDRKTVEGEKRFSDKLCSYSLQCRYQQEDIQLYTAED